ncbi:hypothetical protein CEUSTIGMA_g2315.t1 [Chlamydomonas eustigma]|uniref:PPM-type phosphatase domain-containing protein n=1 Tax=Chlamydomonas eustigma TaxID=1157962 RepID=A0A250WVY5_9CHLO|nr:hypothetical protein CEUSTIGMA_g2315.t1 [Chlamydomonas eustigma]|eukprot:GAX74869.1 hypothetical protein CEUSTIGMA_g2315.t1 [Chlamydomonas eustigma]
MGCLFSKYDTKGAGAGLTSPYKPSVSAHVYESHSTIRGLRFFSSTAEYAASTEVKTKSRVVNSEDYIFASLFEGYGGMEAADFSHRTAYATFCTNLKREEGDIPNALQHMMCEIDEGLAKSSRIKPLKGCSGAGAVVAVIDLRNNVLHAASVGGCVCLISHSVGSFKQATAEADLVANGLKTWASVQGLRNVSNPSDLDLQKGCPHVLGFGRGKCQDVADAYAKYSDTPIVQIAEPRQTLKIEAGSRHLLPGEGNVLLLSAGYLDLMPVTSTAILAHHFPTRDIQALLDVAHSAGVVSDGGEAGSIADRNTNLSNEGMSPPADSHAANGMKERCQFNLSRILASYAVSRGEAHRHALQAPTSSVAVVSIAIDYPSSASDRQLQQQRLRDMWKSRRNLLAVHRWNLVRQYLRFQHSLHKSFRKAWLDVAAGLMAQADAQARQAERVAWQHLNEAVQVTRTGLVMRPGSRSIIPSPGNLLLTAGNARSRSTELVPTSAPPPAVTTLQGEVLVTFVVEEQHGTFPHPRAVNKCDDPVHEDAGKENSSPSQQSSVSSLMLGMPPSPEILRDQSCFTPTLRLRQSN